MAKQFPEATSEISFFTLLSSWSDRSVQIPDSKSDGHRKHGRRAKSHIERRSMAIQWWTSEWDEWRSQRHALYSQNENRDKWMTWQFEVKGGEAANEQTDCLKTN